MSKQIVSGNGIPAIRVAKLNYYSQPWISGTLLQTPDDIVWVAYTNDKGRQCYRRVTKMNGELLANVSPNTARYA